MPGPRLGTGRDPEKLNTESADFAEVRSGGSPVLSYEQLWSTDDQGFLPGVSEDVCPSPLRLRDPHAFALEPAGESMTDAGIQPGDELVIAPSLAPESGDIVLALFKHEQTCTVKRLRLITGGKRALLVSETHAGETREIALDGNVKLYLVYSWVRRTRARRRR